MVIILYTSYRSRAIVLTPEELLLLDKEAVYVDGSIRKVDGGYCGGAAAIAFNKGELYYRKGSAHANTTSNRMELTAAIHGIRYLNKKSRGDKVYLISDSQYVIKGYTEYRHNWVKNDWETRARQPVANLDLWHKLIAEAENITVMWCWIRGHDATAGNIEADLYANHFADRALATVLKRKREL